MTLDTPLHQLGLAEAARLIASGKITSEALVSACLARIAERETVVQAWSSIDPDYALAQARGCDTGPSRGPLHGVPIGVKDVLDTYDMPTEMGSPIYKGLRPAWDASCVALARAAGAVILGKTVTCEFAGMAPGATTNPHDASRTPGGSSSGSGAAVADFMVPLAFGTQTGGSVLRPAAFCGVMGYKPTFGTFNRAGVKFAAESLDTIGLIARDLEDLALMRAVLTNSEAVAPAMPQAQLRIGVCQTYLWHKAEPGARAALERAASAAREAGAHVEDFVLPPPFSELTATREILNNVERARSLAYEWTHHRSAISPALTRSIELGLATTDQQYRAALRVAEWCRLELDTLFGAFDVLLTPSANGEAPEGIAYAGDPSFQGLWTLLHVPTISLPAGRGPNRMPVGVQMIAPRYGDHKLLDAAHWLIARAGVHGLME
ncbi:MAG: amidase [Hyphomicrobiales bacterium]|nr:amidase [Hyphomicrobiales bacterium]